MTHTPPTGATGAPIISAEHAVLRYGTPAADLACLYVHVDARAGRDVADFLARWRRCCDEVAVDWQALRRPMAALVGLELLHCCGPAPARLRLVFDVRKDGAALDALVETGVLVVGSRPYGAFANCMVAYGVEPGMIRAAVSAAEQGLKRLIAFAS